MTLLLAARDGTGGAREVEYASHPDAGKRADGDAFIMLPGQVEGMAGPGQQERRT